MRVGGGGRCGSVYRRGRSRDGGRRSVIRWDCGRRYAGREGGQKIALQMTENGLGFGRKGTIQRERVSNVDRGIGGRIDDARCLARRLYIESCYVGQPRRACLWHRSSGSHPRSFPSGAARRATRSASTFGGYRASWRSRWGSSQGAASTRGRVGDEIIRNGLSGGSVVPLRCS